MAKPRIFVSSTYYDLKHIRTSLESFIHSFGYEPVLFESGDIFFSHEKPLDESCYNELKNCHMQVLIIGGSYGSAESSVKLTEKQRNDQYELFDSITKKEFEAARERNIPMYFFVENSVLAEYNTFKNNRDNTTIKYAHVSSTNVFLFIDSIYALLSGNYIKGFTNFDDISFWLKNQWAHLLADFITNRSDQVQLSKLNHSVERLNEITGSLKEYTEAILTKVEPKKAIEIKTNQDLKHQESIFNLFKDSILYLMIKRCSSKFPVEEVYINFIESSKFSEFINSIFSRDELDKIGDGIIRMMRVNYVELKNRFTEFK